MAISGQSALKLLTKYGAPRPRWRRIREDLIVRYAPSTSHGKRLSALARERLVLSDIINKIASGDLEAAHRVLAAVPPAG